jgi:uncharacterized protein (DUF433 family)
MKAESLDRITLNPEIFGGKPIIRGVRIKVSNIIEFLAAGIVEKVNKVAISYMKHRAI